MRTRSRKTAAPVERTLYHDARRIPYRLYLGDRRGLRIAVTPDLVVNVFAPSRASGRWLEKALQNRAAWIVNTLDKVAACEVLSLPEQFTAGDIISFLGKHYKLAIVESGTESSELFFDSLVVAVRNPSDCRAVGRAVKQWYRDRAAVTFRQAILRCLPAASRFGVTEPVVTIRNMRGRWGSCASTGHVTLNLKLVMVAEDLIDYVVMHELCHLVHHDHSKRFYGLMTRCMPDWKRRKKALDGYRMK